jgi:hypothetical protein
MLQRKGPALLQRDQRACWLSDVVLKTAFSILIARVWRLLTRSVWHRSIVLWSEEKIITLTFLCNIIFKRVDLHRKKPFLPFPTQYVICGEPGSCGCCFSCSETCGDCPALLWSGKMRSLYGECQCKLCWDCLESSLMVAELSLPRCWWKIISFGLTYLEKSVFLFEHKTCSVGAIILFLWPLVTSSKDLSYNFIGFYLQSALACDFCIMVI